MGRRLIVGLAYSKIISLRIERWLDADPRYCHCNSGKMKLFEHHLVFTSQFNSKTLFGYTDIRIPKWDIYQITPGKNLLSVKITV